jgi:hypothetical protein
MDEEKASEVVIRITTKNTDKMCVCLILILFRAYISGSWKAMFSKALVRPLMLFIYEPIVQLLGLYMAFVYGLLYSMCPESPELDAILYLSVFITTIHSIFRDVYHDRVGIAGLHYLAFGIGLTGGSQINAIFMDRIYMFLKSRNGGIGRPEFRLRVYLSSFFSSNFRVLKPLILSTLANIVPGTLLVPMGLLLTGWTAQNHVFWLVPDVVSELNSSDYSQLGC